MRIVKVKAKDWVTLNAGNILHLGSFAYKVDIQHSPDEYVIGIYMDESSNKSWPASFTYDQMQRIVSPNGYSATTTVKAGSTFDVTVMIEKVDSVSYL